MANLATMSLASATGTRTDSACKHIRVCRVAQDYICNWIGMSLQELKSNKYKYAVQKDDLFIACGSPIFEANACFTNLKPYALGLGHLTDLSSETKKFIAYINNLCMYAADFDYMIEQISKKLGSNNSYNSKVAREIKGIPEFYFGGVALTNGFPHGGIADTALSVLTGGMHTVQNGPFHINAGDVCTWIWSFELCFFDEHGKRKPLSPKDTRQFLQLKGGLDNTHKTFDDVIATLCSFCPAVSNESAPGEDTSSKRRRLFYDEQVLRVNKGSSSNEGKKTSYPLIVPLRHAHRWSDRDRAFGVCLMSARPNEKTDIMISRQGM